jgi:hypothetical protein
MAVAVKIPIMAMASKSNPTDTLQRFFCPLLVIGMLRRSVALEHMANIIVPVQSSMNSALLPYVLQTRELLRPMLTGEIERCPFGVWLYKFCYLI